MFESLPLEIRQDISIKAICDYKEGNFEFRPLGFTIRRAAHGSQAGDLTTRDLDFGPEPALELALVQFRYHSTCKDVNYIGLRSVVTTRPNNHIASG